MGMFDDLEKPVSRTVPRQSGGMFDDLEADIGNTKPAPRAASTARTVTPQAKPKTATEQYREEGGGFIKSLEKGLMSLMALTAPAGAVQAQSAAGLSALMGDKRSKEIVADVGLPQRSLEKALQQHNAMPKNPLGANIAAAYEAKSGIDAPLAAAKELVTNPRLAGEYLTEMLVPALVGGGVGGGGAKLTADAMVKRLAPGLVKKLAPRAAAGAGANSGATFTGGLVPNTAAAYEENGGDLESAVATGLKQTGVESAVAAPFGAVLPFGRGVKVNAGKALAVSPIDEVAQTVAGNASIGKGTSGGEMIASALLGGVSAPVDIGTAIWAAKQGQGVTPEPTVTPQDMPPEAAATEPSNPVIAALDKIVAATQPQQDKPQGMFDDIEADMTADPMLPDAPAPEAPVQVAPMQDAPAPEAPVQQSEPEIMPAPEPVEAASEEQNIPVDQSAAPEPIEQTYAAPDVPREIASQPAKDKIDLSLSRGYTIDGSALLNEKTGRKTKLTAAQLRYAQQASVPPGTAYNDTLKPDSGDVKNDHEETPAVHDMGRNEDALPVSNEPIVQVLRGARDNGLQGMGGQLRGVPDGYGRAPDQEPLVGAAEQRSGVSAGKRGVGDQKRAEQEQAQQPPDNARRGDADVGGMGGESRSESRHAAFKNQEVGSGEGADSREERSIRSQKPSDRRVQGRDTQTIGTGERVQDAARTGKSKDVRRDESGRSADETDRGTEKGRPHGDGERRDETVDGVGARDGYKSPNTPLASELRVEPGASSDAVAQDRRHDPARRKNISEMTPDEMRRELLVDAMTGLGNRRAYEEADKLATQVSIDADGLKWINDNLGHESGDRLLETIGKVIAEETTNGFHISGDEYVIQTHTKEEADAIMARVVERLNDVTIESTTTDGDVVTMRGIGISYGIDGDLNNAEKALREHKAQREREGLRGGRGAIPPNAVIGKQGGQDQQNNDTAEEEKPTLELTGQTAAEIAAAGNKGAFDKSDPNILNSEVSHTLFGRYAEFGTEPVVWGRVKADALKVSGLSSDVRFEVGKQMPPNVPMRFDLARRVVEVNRSLGITHAEAVQYAVEELLHSVDALNGTHTLSASSARLDLETGDIALEVKQHFDDKGTYAVFFQHPLADGNNSPDRIKAELFARLGTLYFGEPDLMRQELPLAYGAFDGIFQIRVNPVTREVSRSIRGVAGGLTQARSESGPVRSNAGRNEPGAGNRENSELGRLRDAVSEAFGANRRGQRVDLNRLETRRVPSGPRSPQQPIRYPKQSGFNLDPETAIEGVQRKHQDSMNRWAKVQRQIAEQGGTVGLDKDVYHAMERMSGRAADRIDQFTHATIKPLLSRMTELETGLDEIGTYLMALGAKDRNAYIQTIRQDMPDNGSGVSDAEAAQIIDDYKQRTDFAEFDQLARDFQQITDRKLKVLVGGGVITQQQAEKAQQDFGFYVPYKGFEKIDETGQRGNGTGLGYSTPSRASKRAFGRVSKAGQVVENIIRDYEAAVILAEKVNVGRYARALADANPDPALWTVDQPPTQPVMTGGSVALMQAQFDAENEIRYIENGKAVRIQLHDPLLAQTYNNLGQEPLNTLLRAGDALNRVLRQTYTQKNPAFIFVNAMRDIQTGLAAITGEMGAASAIKSLKHAPGAWRAASAESLNRGSVTGEWAKYMAAYRKSGAAVAYYAIGDIEAKQSKLNELLAREGGLSLLDQWKQKGGGLAGAKASAKLAFWRTYNNAVVDVIEALNGGFENMMRLSAFRQYIDEHGGIDNVSRETLAEASRIAKNLTVNFNRKGEKTRAMNSAYLFWNANVQGSQNLYRIATKSIHNKQVKALMGGMVGLGFLMSMSTDDEDDELTPGYVKNTSIVLHIDGKRIQIPLAYGLGYFVAMGYEMGSLVKGRQTPVRTGLNMLSSALMHFSPLGTPIHDGDTDIKSLAIAGTPTILKPIVMSATNRNSMGYEVVPKYDDEAPDRPAMRASTRGGVYDKAAGGLEAVGLDVSPESIKMATTFISGGLGTFLADSVSASMAGSKGEFDPEKTPILKRFYGVNDIEEHRARFYDQTEDVQTQAREQGKKQKEFFGSNKSEDSVQDFRKVMKELREEEMDAYAKNNFTRAEALQEKQIKLATRFKVLHDRMIKTGRIEKR